MENFFVQKHGNLHRTKKDIKKPVFKTEITEPTKKTNVIINPAKTNVNLAEQKRGNLPLIDLNKTKVEDEKSRISEKVSLK